MVVVVHPVEEELVRVRLRKCYFVGGYEEKRLRRPAGGLYLYVLRLAA
jgi:hypothetical protein